LWSPHGIEWVCWEYEVAGGAVSDRWDDYWSMVHELAVKSLPAQSFRVNLRWTHIYPP